MPELLTIDRNNKLPPEQDYNFLKKEGIRLIEDLSGHVWSDYNTHDPGITLLEAMCYALTDLGYRTSFSIADLLAKAQKSHANSWERLFYTAHQALPCNPLTPVDYRKIIIDTEGVRNAWVEISDDYEILIYLQKMQNEAGRQQYDLTYDYTTAVGILQLRGLYKVFVEYEDEVLEEKNEEAVAQLIWKKLQSHRNLTEDFISVSSIEYEYFPIEAIIQVSEGTDIELINARIYKVIHDFFSPPISFYSLEQMLEKNYSPEEIFEGPVLNYGFIDTGELEKSERFKNIHLSDVINLISGIEGVIAIKKFAFPLDSQSPFSNFTEWINIVKDQQKTPKLDIANSVISFERSGDRHRSENQKTVNKDRVNALFAFLRSDNFKTRLKGSGKDLPVPEGEFMDTADYYPFQKNLPATYGMMENLLNRDDNVTKPIVAQAVHELVAEKAGVNAAHLLGKLTAYKGGSDVINNFSGKLIAATREQAQRVVVELVEAVIGIIKDDNNISKLVEALTGDYVNPHSAKAGLHAYAEEEPSYVAASGKTVALQQLAADNMGKALYQIDNKGDISALNALHKKYRIDQLDKRKKLVLQLRGFLMPFEQVLADFLSQLSHIYEIFSVDEHVEQSFYPQVVDGIEDVEALFIDFKRYKDQHLRMIETPEKFSNRQNKLLDHLLSRFSESMEKYSFFMKQFAGEQAGKQLIADKSRFLSDYVQVSSYRGRGYNYAEPNGYWDSKNVAGLKKRICRLLGISDYTREKIAPPAIFIEKIIIDNNVERYIVTLVDPSNKGIVLLRSRDVEFESEAIIILTYILEEAFDRNLYKKEGHGNKWSFELLRATPENDLEPVAYSPHYQAGPERDGALELTLSTLNTIADAENFHVLEHILLRPKIGSRERGAAADEVSLLAAEYVPESIDFADKVHEEMVYKFKIMRVKDKSGKNRHLWRLSLLKNDAELLVINEEFAFYKHLTRRMQHIRESAADTVNYITQPKVDGYYNFKIMSGGTVLAESKKNYRKTEEIDEEIKGLINFLSYELDLISGEVDENNPAFYADPYSFQISIILPSWQRRFRNSTFKHLLEKTIYLETPAHIYPHVYWVDHNEMREFDEAYELWTEEMAKNEIPATDVVNNLVNVLTRLRK